MMLKHALKEWAVICRALAEGKQAILLRKGGIAEAAGAFVLEHTRFWLFPTFTHQQRAGIRREALPLLKEAEAQRPPQGSVRLTHFGEVGGVYQVRDLTRALLLGHLHFWSEETVQARFAYRHPGLDVMAVRVFKAPQEFELSLTSAYAGCRSWVELDAGLSTHGAVPVLSAGDFRDAQRSLDLLLNPTALA
jgi:hypothetical protein